MEGYIYMYEQKCGFLMNEKMYNDYTKDAIRRIKVWICIIMYYLRWILILIKKKEEEISIF